MPECKSIQEFQEKLYAAKDPDATWLCDSMAVYMQGKEVSNEALEAILKKEKQLENILNGRTHIIWTGGEPTLQQLWIMDFLNYLFKKYPKATIYSEIETNGTTRTATDFFGKYIQQVNCSPKLANSGNRRGMRINPGVLAQINAFENSWFKFVVSTEVDIQSARREFIEPNHLDEKKIILMPGLSERKHYFERTKWIYEMGKKYGYRAVSRGHIAAWDKTTGV